MVNKITSIKQNTSIVFYIFMTCLLAGFGIQGVRLFLQQGEPRWAMVTALLFGLHIGLHLLTMKQFESTRWLIFYYVTQTMLMTILLFLPYGSSFFAINVVSSAALSMAAEALGLWGNSRRALTLIGLYTIYLASVYFGQLNFESAIDYIKAMGINGGFFLILVAMLNKQEEERERAEALAISLGAANQQLETLTLTTERQRMARELHDTLAQGVTGLVLQLEAVKAHLDHERVGRSAEIIDQALAQARSTLADSRAAIDDLRIHPHNLDEAIRRTVERFSQATGIQCDLHLNAEMTKLPSEVGDHAVRILSEALSNVTRHAQATQVIVDFQDDGDQLTLTIQDNGRGFDPETATRSGHYGLLGIRERARLIDGEIKIESDGQTGTKIVLHVPLQNLNQSIMRNKQVLTEVENGGLTI